MSQSNKFRKSAPPDVESKNIFLNMQEAEESTTIWQQFPGKDKLIFEARLAIIDYKNNKMIWEIRGETPHDFQTKKPFYFFCPEMCIFGRTTLVDIKEKYLETRIPSSEHICLPEYRNQPRIDVYGKDITLQISYTDHKIYKGEIINVSQSGAALKFSSEAKGSFKSYENFSIIYIAGNKLKRSLNAEIVHIEEDKESHKHGIIPVFVGIHFEKELSKAAFAYFIELSLR